MAVDHNARSNLRDALVSYMKGDIYTFAFDDRNSVYFETKLTEDRSVREIARRLYLIHDDLIDHPISVGSGGWVMLKQVVVFLATDLEIDATATLATLTQSWPFRDESEWLANEHRGSDVRLAEYDPEIHGRWRQPWWNRIPSAVGFAMILGSILVMALAFKLTH